MGTFFYIAEVEFEQSMMVYGDIMRIFIEQCTEDNIGVDQLSFEFELIQTRVHDQVRLDFIPHKKTGDDIPKFSHHVHISDYFRNSIEFQMVLDDFKDILLAYVAVKYGSNIEKDIDTLAEL